jgi:hypothetical protein
MASVLDFLRAAAERRASPPEIGDRTMKHARFGGAVIVALGLLTVACGGEPTSSGPGALLVNVVPAGGAESVDPTGSIVVQFDHPIHGHMADYAALHLGDVNGPVVAGAWSLREGGTELVFQPARPLEAVTDYTIHIGGGMTDTRGRHVDLETHGPHLGGQSAGTSMMGGSMMSGMKMEGSHPHMGDGWRHPANASHGMTFTFRTSP